MELVAKSLPQLTEIASGLYKHKNKFIPPVPKSINEIKIKGEYEMCEDKVRKFVLFHNNQMIIFCSAIGLKILSECNRWHGDGTFSVVPDGFYQLYVIHGLYKSNMLPCVFALLTGKSEDLYKKLLSELKDGALRNSLELKPTQLTIDFELAVMGAFQYHFPRIEISGCFFHFGQSLYRKIVNFILIIYIFLFWYFLKVDIGLKTQYQEDENLRKYVKKINTWLCNLIHDYGAKKTPSTTTSTVTTTSNDSDNLSGEEIDISVWGFN